MAQITVNTKSRYLERGYQAVQCLLYMILLVFSLSLCSLFCPFPYLPLSLSLSYTHGKRVE